MTLERALDRRDHLRRRGAARSSRVVFPVVDYDVEKLDGALVDGLAAVFGMAWSREPAI
ncbi:MAG: hypothetical protein OES32_11520 [Acidobacteriota bacterium]|nr:hypothetical protein [Acidobacteriota bacterium]